MSFLIRFYLSTIAILCFNYFVFAPVSFAEDRVTLLAKISVQQTVFASDIDPLNPKRVAVYNGQGVLELWNFETLQQEWVFNNLFAHVSPYASIRFSPDSRRIALTTLSSRPFFNVVDNIAGTLVFQQPEIYPESPRVTAWPPQTAFAADHRFMLSETNIEGQIDFISTEENRVLAKLEMAPSNQRRVFRLGFSPDHKFIFASTSLELRIWNSTTLQLLRSISYKNIANRDGSFTLSDLAVTSDFRFAAFALASDSNNDHKVVIFDLQREALLDSLPIAGVGRIAFNRTSQLLTIVSGQGFMYRYDLVKGAIIWHERFSDLNRSSYFNLNTVAFSDDCDMVLTDFNELGQSNELALWSIANP